MTLAQVKLVADGRVHVANDAIKLGLVDAIGNFDDVLAELQTDSPSVTAVRGLNATRATLVKAEAPKPLPTGQQAITAFCDIERALAREPGVTWEQAKRRAKIENPKLYHNYLEAARVLPAPKKPDTTVAQQRRPKTMEDPIKEFHQRVVEAQKRQPGLDRDHAVSAVIRADPELHKRYLVATNEALGKKAAVAHLR